jgi:hypothetical protein
MSSRTEDPGLVTQPTSTAPPVATVGGPEDGRRGWRRRPRQTRVVIRKVGPWSVFKFSILFYFCVMLVILLALAMIYSVLGAIGALDSITKLLREAGFDNFRIHGDWLFTRLAMIGVAMVFIWALINVFVAFLYNLISDVVGGVEVTLAERR